jgi:amino acid adenylation domain-containing protein
MAEKSTLDIKALKANRNISARNHWKTRMAGLVFRSYFGHYARGYEEPPVTETYTATAPEEVYRSLISMAPSGKAQYLVLLAALAVLGNKYAGTDDMVVLSPSLAGDSIMPVRIQDFSGSSFRELLLMLKDQLMADMKHSDYPLEKKLGVSEEEIAKLSSTGMMLKGLHEFNELTPGILFSFTVKDSLIVEVIANRQQCNDHIELLPGLYVSLLEKILADPAQKIADIELCAEQEEQPALNDVPSLMHCWEHQAVNHPAKKAVIAGNQSIDFGHLNEDAGKLARYLCDKGVQPGQAVGVLLERSIAYVTGVLAGVKAGAVIVPIDPAYSDELISTIIKDAAVACVISREEILLKRDIKLFSAQICIDKHKPAIDKYPANGIFVPASGMFFVQYSTRVAEEPVGIGRSLEDFMAQLQWRWNNHPCPPEAKCLQSSNLRNSDHLFEIFAALLQGNTLVMQGDEDAVELINKHDICTITATPAMLPQLIKTNLRYIFCTGERLPLSLASKRIVNVYSNAEAGMAAANGKPIANKKISILNNKLRPVPKGVPGRVWIGDVETADIGMWSPDGLLEILGRVDEDISVGRYNFRSVDLEALLHKHEQIEKAIVVGGENPEEKYLLVYYTAKGELEHAQLLALLAEKLPASLPVHFLKMDEFALTSRGKIDCTLLPDPVTTSEERYVPPSNELEEKLVETWADILKLDRNEIGVNASFFRLGGNSLRAITLVNKIHGLFGVDISVKEVFKRKSIRNLAGLLQASAKSEYTRFRKAEEREYYDLSISQQRLFYLHELDHSSLTLNIPTVLRLEGELDFPKLKRSFYQMVERQESLRTSFRTINEKPVQLVTDNFEFDVEYFQATEEEVEDIIQGFIRPFNIAVPPLFRVGLIQTAPTVYYLMVDIHHIITDGTSMGLLVKDFMALYSDAAQPVPDLHYKDYATWQQSKGYRKKSERQKNFWINEFAEPIVSLNLPIDFIRPSGSATDGALIKFDFNTEETKALRALAQSEVVTTSMLLLSILNVLFAKMAHQEDIVIGMATAGREDFVLDNMIGMFPVVLPLRNHPKGNLKFNEFLAGLRTKFLSALDNQGYHYEDLAKELRIERTTDRNPWFDVLFLYQNFEKPELHMPGMSVSMYKEKNIVAHEKLNMTITESEDQIFFRLVYSKLLFRRETIERLVKYLKQVAAAVVRDAGIRIADIELVSADEKARLLHSFSNLNTAPLANETFTDVFHRQVAKTPQSIAVEHNGKKLSYQKLDAIAKQLAARLQNAGAAPGRNVIIYMPRSIEMLASIIATFYTGAAYIPVDIGFPTQRVAEILADSEANIIVTTTELAATVNHPINVICADDTTEAGELLPVQKNVQDLAYIIYTSGTTGKPKGVMIHQLGMMNHLHAMVKVLDLHEKDIIAQTASPSFDISVWQFLNALIIGAKTLIIDNEKILDPPAMLAELRTKEVTIFQSVPSLMTTFLEDVLTEEDRALPHLRWMIPTGEPLNVPLAKKWYACYPEIPLLNAYGPAEASDDVTTCVVKAPTEGQQAIPVGKPVQNMQVFILDNALKLCPIGVKGEICVAGVGVGKGYWKDEEKTKRSFVPNPFATGAHDATLYKTGDVGYYLEDGNIVCLGRKDDQVKIRGLRIELGEIESRLLQHSAIREVAILVREWSGSQHLVAYYVADKEIKAAELETYLSAHLPQYMIPSYFIYLAELPVTLNGKLDRRALPDPDIKSKEVYLPPTTETEQKLADIWSRVLNTGSTPISIDASFFYLGGHSLNAITVINKIYKEFDVKISLREFFVKPTIQSIAGFIEAHRWVKEEAETEELDRTELIV